MSCTTDNLTFTDLIIKVTIVCRTQKCLSSHIYKDQLVDPYTYVYNTAVFSKNGEAPVFYKDAYQTDIIHAKTRAALKRLESSEDPFFLWGKWHSGHM